MIPVHRPQASGALAVNRDRRLVLMDNDDVIPITNMIDADGAETDAADEAIGFVAGPTRAGEWLAGLFEAFDERPLS